MLDVATRLALGPILVVQASRLRRTAPELPEPNGPRRGTVGCGAQRLRLLVAGDSSAAGVGARTQREALARPLAERLAQRIAGSVRWQLVAQSGLTSQGVLQLLQRTRPAEADIAVIVVGVNDITKDVPLAFALRQRQHIADWLRVHAGVRHVIFPALPEMEKFPAVPKPLAWYVGQAARRNNRAQRRWADGLDGVTHLAMEGVTHSELFCHDGLHPAPALYALVADRLADHIAALADAGAANRFTTEAG
jgi:lysophospholipase L1-like esterase